MRSFSFRNHAVANLTLVTAFILISQFIFPFAQAAAPGPGLQVTLLTPQGSRVLKSWSSDDLQKMSRNGAISAMQFFEDSTQGIDWKERAEIDLLNVYGQKPEELVRLPKFIMVRDWVKLHYHSKSGRVSLELSSRAQTTIPRVALEVESVSKIELTAHHIVYPGIQLKIRTNPAASRGEKLYTQTCLGCHSVPGRKPLDPKLLTKNVLSEFAATHSTYKDLVLNPKDVRGLEVYRDALGSEKNEVKSPK